MIDFFFKAFNYNVPVEKKGVLKSAFFWFVSLARVTLIRVKEILVFSLAFRKGIA